MMGLEFNNNSIYIGWSALFDYSTLQTLQASEFLPDPMRKVYVNNDNGVDISNQIDQVIKIEQKINDFNTQIQTIQTKLDNAKKQTDKDEYTVQIEDLTNQKNEALVKRINAYVDLISYLNRSVTAITQNGRTVYLVSFEDNDNRKAVMANVARHEFTQLSKDNREAAQKNFISSHIQNTIQDIRNYNLANTPITLDDMKHAANNISAKGAITDNMSILNPMTLIQMQIQNIQAKGCVGIAANGEKAAYMFHYYLQDIYENPTTDKKKYVSFKFETSRIQNRNTGNPTKRIIQRAPDINKENVKDRELLNLWKNFETGNLTSDEIISQLITIAVDNAKELVLPKVNAGSNFMKCYLFLATMGFQVSDMAAFMCSGAVEFVDQITNKNRFANQSIQINDAIKIAQGDYSSIYWKILDVSISDIVDAVISYDQELKQQNNRRKRQVSLTEKQKSSLNAKYTKQLQEGDVTEILKKLQKKVNEFYQEKTKYSGEHYLIKDGIIQALQFIQSIKQIEKQCIGMYKTEDAKKDFIADAKELANILEGANEFSQLGKILGMNQGLDATKLDQGKFENAFSYIMGQRVKAVLDYVSNNQDQTKYSDEVIQKCEKFEKVDLRKFVLDQDYRKQIKDFYNEIKVTVNIYDVIDSIDQFNSILRLEAFLLDMEQGITMKSRIYSYITGLLSQQSGVNKGDKIGLQMDDRYIENMLTTIDKIMIENYLVKQSGFEIAHGNAQGIASDYSTKELPQGILNFENLSDIASFKKLFEEYIIPDLKKGTYYIINKDNSIQKKTDDNVKNNDFIQSLIPDQNGQIPFYKVDIDMSLVDQTIESGTSFNRYLRALRFLHNYKIDNKGHTLADLFVLYNLIVNQNKYGQDRMTRFFDEEVNKQSVDLSPVLYEYFQWVGEVDYLGKINETGDHDIQINIMDLLAGAARYEAEGNGQYHQNPSYYERRQVGNDYVYMLKIRKKAYDYDNGKQQIARNNGETEEQYQERMSNYYLYVTLPGTNAFDAQNLIDQLFSNDLNTMLNAIRKLEQDKEIFLLSKYCV